MSDARDDSSPVQTPAPGGHSGAPEPTLDQSAQAVTAGHGTGPETDQETGPETEADRQAAKTIRSISRLEESN